MMVCDTDISQNTRGKRTSLQAQAQAQAKGNNITTLSLELIELSSMNKVSLV
jgi:hypothetical protein